MYVYAHAYIQKHTSIRNILWKNTGQTIHIRIHSIQFILILAVMSWGCDNTPLTYTQMHNYTQMGGRGVRVVTINYQIQGWALQDVMLLNLWVCCSLLQCVAVCCSVL